MHRWPPAEPVLSPGSCADRSPAAREQPLLKLQPGRKQEPALAKHQLGARNSPGPGTHRFLGTNFPARGTQSITAWPCHGQGGREAGKAIFQPCFSNGSWVWGLLGPFPGQPGQPSVPGGRFQVLFLGSQGSPAFLAGGTTPPQILGPSRLHSMCQALGVVLLSGHTEGLGCQTLPGTATVLCQGYCHRLGWVPQGMRTPSTGPSAARAPFCPSATLGEPQPCALNGPHGWAISGPHTLAWYRSGLGRGGGGLQPFGAHRSPPGPTMLCS